MNQSDQNRAEHERNTNAIFGWIAAGTTMLAALLFLMFSTPVDRVANDGSKPATTGQSNTE
jgi:hypothetical protein